MKVKLSSVGNPDFGQNPNQPMYGCEKNKTVKITSFKEAKEICMKFIKDNDLGGGNWNGGQIMNDEGVIIAHVSYNGRVWEGADYSTDAKEIAI
jgi:hypothetical protein